MDEADCDQYNTRLSAKLIIGPDMMRLTSMHQCKNNYQESRRRSNCRIMNSSCYSSCFCCCLNWSLVALAATVVPWRALSCLLGLTHVAMYLCSLLLLHGAICSGLLLSSGGPRVTLSWWLLLLELRGRHLRLRGRHQLNGLADAIRNMFFCSLIILFLLNLFDFC